MPTEKFAVRHVRDVLGLKSAGMPIREIARRMGSGPFDDPPVRGRGATWPFSDDDTELETGCSPAWEPVPAPGGYRYSRLCELSRAREVRLFR